MVHTNLRKTRGEISQTRSFDDNLGAGSRWSMSWQKASGFSAHTINSLSLSLYFTPVDTNEWGQGNKRKR